MLRLHATYISISVGEDKRKFHFIVNGTTGMGAKATKINDAVKKNGKCNLSSI